MDTEMLKGKNAYKQLILSLFFTCVIQAQNIKGTYCLEENGERIDNCITFLENNKFIYKGHCGTGDLGQDYGVGIYTLNKNNLTLDFNLTKQSYNSYHNTERVESERDSIIINIEVIDMEVNKPLIFANTSIDTEKKVNKSTDKEGLVSFKVKKSKIPKQIKVSYMGYNSYSFYLNHNADYNIKVFLYGAYGCDIYDQEWKFAISEQTNNSFVLSIKNRKDARFKKSIWKKEVVELSN